MPTIEINSLFSGSDRPRVVTVDAYAVNPLADELKSLWPTEYSLAKRVNGDPPKMFLAGSSDTPPFTASGFDPSHLLLLPYRVRHAVAATPSIALAQSEFERHVNDPYAHIEHEGLTNAVTRLNQWLIVPDDQLTPDDVEALYLNVYGAMDAAKAPLPAPIAPSRGTRW